MKRNRKTSSLMSLHENDFSKIKNPTFHAKPDIFLQSFIDLKKKYGDIKENINTKNYQKTKEESPSSKISQLIYRQISIKKKTRFILPPLRNKNRINNKEGKSFDPKFGKQQEVFDLIKNIKERNEMCFNRTRLYEAQLNEKKVINSHEFLSFLLLKKGFMH